MIGYADSQNYLYRLKEQGKEFFHQKYYELANAAVLNFLIDYTQHTSGEQTIFVEPGFFSTTHGPVEINIYRNSEYSGGENVPFYCTNTLKDTSMETVVTTAATGSNKGTLTEARIAGFGSTNQSSGGSSSQVGTEFIRGGGKTLIEITNKSGNTVQITYAQIFFEV